MRPISENGEKRIELVKSNIVKKGTKREENKENKMPTHANQSHLFMSHPFFSTSTPSHTASSARFALLLFESFTPRYGKDK
jgi:hypothetical protein